MKSKQSLSITQSYSLYRQPVNHKLLNDEAIRSFLKVFSDNDKFCDHFVSLWNFREAAEELFIYSDSPLKGQKDHPLYKAMSTANELIGILITGQSVDTVTILKNLARNRTRYF